MIKYILDHAKTELYNINTGKWSTHKSCPTINGTIGAAPVIYINRYFYIFGGDIYATGADFDYTATPFIKLYDISIDSWFLAGSLNYSKRGHNALQVSSDTVLVVGLATESCYLSEFSFECSEQDPILPRGLFYPELFYFDNYDDCQLESTTTTPATTTTTATTNPFTSAYTAN